jgi:glutamate synthase (NADPH/NADH) small chain
VLGINQPPVTIKNVEVTIIDKAWDSGDVTPQPPERLSGKTVAVIGSGPAGLAAAQQLTRAGHTVAVYERADRIGGLLRYGIPEFKMEKRHINRRIEQMRAEGTKFRTGVQVGTDMPAERLLKRYDAVVIAAGATQWRDLPVPGRELGGVHQAMEYLPLANKVQEGDLVSSPISAEGKHVVVIGGGDTGADCVGTAHRQGAASVTQLEIMPMPPEERPAHQPWPTMPMTFKITSAHEEGGERLYAVSTTHFEGDEDGNVKALHLIEVAFKDGKFEPQPGTERVIPAELVTLAMGFTGTDQKNGLVEQLGIELDARGNIARNADFATNVDGVFVAGDAGRGQSLIVWAIAEGRSAARAVDAYLTGLPSQLPAPIRPTDRPLTV